MFYRAHEFNQNISGWDVSSAIAMGQMFFQAYAFSSANKGLIHESFSSNPNWPYDWRDYVLIDDSNFHSAVDLWFDNQAEANATYGHISDWNTSAVTKMGGAFRDRTDFNEDISNWDTSNVTNMGFMFAGARLFNQPIGAWNVSSVSSMENMFRMAPMFNQQIGDWNTSSVTKMQGMFYRANAFNQNISGWDVSSVIVMREMFKQAEAFSDANKGLIHKSFSSNPNWPYDWSEFVADSNQTAPPTDNNQTQPTSLDNNQTKTQPSLPDHNETKPEVPADHNATHPPVVDKNQTTLPPIKDSNKTTIDPPTSELIVLAPMVATYGHQRDENNTITLYGKIRSDGNGTIKETGFYIRTSMDGNDTVLLADNHSKDDFFSIAVSSGDSFYFQAFAGNEKGETKGAWKRVGATIQSYPIDGVVETGDGWSTSEWFGDFRYFENGWAYHYGLGWVYLSSDEEDGIWLWRKEHGWLWSNQATWPFLWSHASGDWIYLLIREKQDSVFFDYSTGRYGQ
ncbi:MAG: hypothetical protein CMI19_07115 [Opitutae bacterium]|nr:hypothetical protein [Opitutae bacterium]